MDGMDVSGGFVGSPTIFGLGGDVSQSFISGDLSAKVGFTTPGALGWYLDFSGSKLLTSEQGDVKNMLADMKECLYNGGSLQIAVGSLSILLLDKLKHKINEYDISKLFFGKEKNRQYDPNDRNTKAQNDHTATGPHQIKTILPPPNVLEWH